MSPEASAHLAGIPMWAALLVTALAVMGAGVTLIGSIGLTVFRTFYERVHAPTLGTTFGMLCIVTASIVMFSVTDGAPTLKAILVGAFLTVTTPVTLVILARAAIYRDRVEGNDVPADDF